MNDEMIDEFKKEATLKLNASKENLSKLSSGEDFNLNIGLVSKALHSLKGSAGMFGLMDLQAHIGKLESLLDSQKSKGVLTKAQTDYFLNGIEAAFKLLNGESISFNHSSLTEFDFVNSSTPSKGEPGKAKMRGLIFIADNDKASCDQLSKYITALEFNFKIFSSAPELLESLKEENPDLVISGLEGVDIIQKVKELNIPFVALSGSLTKEKILDLLRSDVSGFIEKPIKEELVKLELERLIVQSQVNILLKKSINYILYQFNELDNYLKSAGKENIRVSLKDELKNILHLQKELGQRKK